MAFGIKQILCPVTLDDQCAGSLRLSIRLARDFRARLFVCFCTTRASAIPPDQHRKINEMIERTLDFYAASLDDEPVCWESRVIESGDTAKGIIDEAARSGADLIVMGASRHPILHALLGSVTEKVCRTAPCSVLVTPAGNFPTPVDAGENIFRRILVAHDFSDYSEIALQTATALTARYKAELYLFQVITETPRQEPELVWSRAAKSPYHQTIERLKTVVTSEFKKVPRVVIAARWGKPYREILSYSREHDVDLIAMGAQGADFGSNTLFGSNVDRVLRQSACAVLVARPHRPAVDGNGNGNGGAES